MTDGMTDELRDPARPVRKRYPYRTVLVVIIVGVLMMRMFGNQHPPEPETSAFLLEPGRVSRALLSERFARGGKQPLKFSPHHANYVSTAGDVEFYIFPFTSSEDSDQVARMMQLSEDLEAGKELTGFAGKTKGKQGRLSFPKDIWTGGMHGFLILMRAAERTELTLEVHYGPENG